MPYLRCVVRDGWRRALTETNQLFLIGFRPPYEEFLGNKLDGSETTCQRAACSQVA